MLRKLRILWERPVDQLLLVDGEIGRMSENFGRPLQLPFRIRSLRSSLCLQQNERYGQGIILQTCLVNNMSSLGYQPIEDGLKGRYASTDCCNCQFKNGQYGLIALSPYLGSDKGVKASSDTYK